MREELHERTDEVAESGAGEGLEESSEELTGRVVSVHQDLSDGESRKDVGDLDSREL